jgi:hypothetical protein
LNPNDHNIEKGKFENCKIEKGKIEKSNFEKGKLKVAS